MPIIENTVCEEMFDQGGHKKKILPSFLCAGYANGQKDSCEVCLYKYPEALLLSFYLFGQIRRSMRVTTRFSALSRNCGNK